MKKLVFNADEFVPSLTAAIAVVQNKTIIPILDNVRIKVVAGESTYATLLTSDSETWLEMRVPLVEATEDCSFCVDCKQLLTGLRGLAGKQIALILDEEKMTFTCKYDTGRFKLPYESADEFPETPSLYGDSKRIDIELEDLRYAIDKTLFSTANEILRPILNGIHFDFFKDRMVAVAANKKTLVKSTTFLQFDGNDDDTVRSFTVPKIPCGILSYIIGNVVEGDVSILYNENIISVSNEKFNIASKLLCGEYAKYDAVLPKESRITVLVDKSLLVSAINRVLPMGNTQSSLVVMKLNSGTMELESEFIDYNRSAAATLECEYTGGEFEIGLNGKTLLSMLKNIDSEKVRLGMTTNMAACVIEECDEIPNKDYTSIMMPMVLPFKNKET